MFHEPARTEHESKLAAFLTTAAKPGGDEELGRVARREASGELDRFDRLRDLRRERREQGQAYIDRLNIEELTPVAPRGRPPITDARYRAAVERARASYGDARGRDEPLAAHVAAKLGVHPKRLPSIRRRLG